MSAIEDDLKDRLAILEERIRKLEKRNGLLAVTLASALVAVFVSFVTVFLLAPEPEAALVLISGFLILFYIWGKRRESSLHKSVETLDEQRQVKES